MNRITAILAPGDVLLGLDAGNKERLFDRVGLLFQANHKLAMSTVTDNLLARERLGSTALGHGVAIPHGRIRGLKDGVAAVVRLREPIGFGAPDGLPTGLFFFLFVPEAATQRHLEILAELAAMLSDRDVRERLMGAADDSALLRVVAAWKPAEHIA